MALKEYHFSSKKHRAIEMREGFKFEKVMENYDWTDTTRNDSILNVYPPKQVSLAQRLETGKTA